MREQSGKLFQPEGEITFAPMEALAETAFAQVNPDATATPVNTVVDEIGLTLTLNFTPEEADPVPVIILKLD